MARGKEHKYVQGGMEVESKAADMKPQGEFAKSKSLGRSTGSEYATAVGSILKEAREKNQTFQEEKKVLDPREQVNRSMLYKGKGQKKKQGD